jgi:hypothetical protein
MGLTSFGRRYEPALYPLVDSARRSVRPAPTRAAYAARRRAYDLGRTCRVEKIGLTDVGSGPEDPYRFLLSSGGRPRRDRDRKRRNTRFR